VPRSYLVLGVMWLASAGCTVPNIDRSEEAAAEVRAQDLGGLPYHPFAFHLDLSIYAYQLYGQTLAWPFDPYYEDAGPGRDALMDRLRRTVERDKNRPSVVVWSLANESMTGDGLPTVASTDV